MTPLRSIGNAPYSSRMVPCVTGVVPCTMKAFPAGFVDPAVGAQTSRRSGRRLAPQRLVEHHVERGLLHAVNDGSNDCLKQELRSRISVCSRVAELFEPCAEFRR